MVTYFLDSNVFFYARILDREYGDVCSHVLKKVVKHELKAISSVLVLTELANALRKYGLSNDVKNVIDAVLSLDIPIQAVDPFDIRNAIILFNDTRISPYDCVHVAVMKRTGATAIISADKDFDKVAGIKRLDPKLI